MPHTKNLLMDSLCLKTRFWGTYFKHFTCQNISNVNISMLLHGTLSCRFITACVWRQVDIHRCQWLHSTRPDTCICFKENAISLYCITEHVLSLISESWNLVNKILTRIIKIFVTYYMRTLFIYKLVESFYKN